MKQTTFGEMLKACGDLTEKLSGFGYVTPSVCMHINWLGADAVVNITFRASDPGIVTQEFFKADDMKDALIAAESYVESLPSVEELKVKEFYRGLGALIEQGRKAGVETDFLNPLEETMKRLSSNIITDQREGVLDNDLIQF